jgi:hypothetical protein
MEGVEITAVRVRQASMEPPRVLIVQLANIEAYTMIYTMTYMMIFQTSATNVQKVHTPML